ncbi:hypothetical protein G7Y89_g14922 [Cudoniella acicularis]|uniref:RNA-dependent RNA polymerase n=1 Tax=Cudoniella acicularis TaxID=354080 RepID=A0A8H4QY07_9HELO|nr:hypothetical protein G7Y89_g14922 [Cudoniella acicularis]
MATPPSMASPMTPSKTSSRQEADEKAKAKAYEIKIIITNVCDAWDLRLPIPEERQSPNKMQKTKEQSCVGLISFLSYKGGIFGHMRAFEQEASRLYQGWALKPKAERGVLPEARRNNPRPVTEAERLQLLDCLFNILNDAVQKWISANPMTPRTLRTLGTSFDGANPRLDDSPVPIAFPKSDKRARDEPANDENIIKKPKIPEATSMEPLGRRSADEMLPPTRGRSTMRDVHGYRSANQSFESAAASSIFSNPTLSFGSFIPANTQETVPDIEDLNFQTQENVPEVGSEDEKLTDSEYAPGSSFEGALATATDVNGLILGTEVDATHVNDNLSQGMMDFAFVKDPETITKEDILKERLEDIFPKLPDELKPTPLWILYELTRVCLHTEVSLAKIQMPSPPIFNDYDTFWQFLKNSPALKDKSFPDRSDREAIYAAQETFAKGRFAVIFSGSFRFNDSEPTRPLFRFQLDPMKLDFSHRLGRRLGNDRFLEIDIPHLHGNKIPTYLAKLGDRAREMIIDWLIDGTHRLLGRSWKPFHTRPKEKKDRRRDILRDEKDDAVTAHRLFLFAVDGYGFRIVPEPRLELSQPRHVKMTIPYLLNIIRPTRKNVHQSILKLFSRTQLALSRNTATVVLQRSQIRNRPDIFYEGKGKEMTDGAGLMSRSLALKVAQKLGLSHFPSGFQGRIGEAKGFWTVHPNDTSGEDWIDVYASQEKWKRSTKVGGESEDESHLTFEVIKSSGPLQSAELNLQLLPLLMDRARDKSLMKSSISNLLELGLTQALAGLRGAMEDTQTLRKWTRECNSNSGERLKHGAVPFRAGQPISKEERLNMLLDVGFHPQTIRYAKELARGLFKTKCDELKKRMNISVARSAYAYMVPDFWGVLEPNEVYIDFSSFVDEASGFSGVRLNGHDILVARSPAHFVSDIQKVKVVVKAELLSGGDYDGDLAWICWEPTIVDNFDTADVPEMPNLVEEGHLKQDTTKYEDLVKEHPEDPVTPFLKKAFAFNMQDSMLGICTSHKEKVCYKSGQLDSKEAVYLSTLLSNLVDQAKQGFKFTMDDWKDFTKKHVPTLPMTPLYKTTHLNPNAKHIIDYLKYVAHQKVEDSLKEFHESLPDPPYWDDDLVAYYKWAENKAKKHDEWKRILDPLNEEVMALKSTWTKHFQRAPVDEEMPTFIPFVLECYERYQAILPREDTPLTQSLLPDFGHSGASAWAELRASALFNAYTRSYVGNMVWWMAGKDLVKLKARSNSHGPPHVIIPSMYVIYRPDNTFIKRLKSDSSAEKVAPEITAVHVGSVTELDDLEDD